MNIYSFHMYLSKEMALQGKTCQKRLADIPDVALQIQ